MAWQNNGDERTKVGGVKPPHLKTKSVTTLMNAAMFSLKREN